MSYRELWEHRQTLPTAIDLTEIRRKLRELTERRVVVHAVDADPELFYGMYLSPKNEDTLYQGVPAGAGAIVVCARLDADMARLVQLKELMHMFDDPMQATTTGEELESLLAGLCEEVRPHVRTPQYQSELDCFWMAIGLMCPEAERVEFVRLREEGRITDQEIATRLQMPEVWIPGLFIEHYKASIDYLLTKPKPA